MPSVTVYTTKDASAIDTPTYNWNGTDDHHPVGRTVSDLYTARSVIYFPISFSGMTTITSAVMWLRGSKSGSSHCFGDSTAKTMYIRRQGKTWVEGASTPENTWTNRTNDYTTLEGATTTDQATKNFSSGITDGTWYSVDITAIVKKWQAGVSNYGVVLVNSNESNPDDGLEFYAREKGSSYRPYVVITYGNNTAPDVPSSLSPSGDDVVPTLTPVFSGVFSDPDSGDSMSGYQIKVWEDDGTTLLWDTGSVASTTIIKQTYAGPPLSYGTAYKWTVRAKDSHGVWSDFSSMQRFITVTLVGGGTGGSDATAPDPITGLSATPGDASITLSWDISAELDVDFDHYEIYRRESGDSEWNSLASIYDKTDTSYEDVTPSFGVMYEYMVTQFKNIESGFDVESEPSDIADAIIAGEVRDEWSVQGADGLPEHSFDLPVTDNPIRTPVQQEIFEPLGSSRKTVVRGRVLGSEGSITAQWDFVDRDQALEQIQYITENRGPHILRSPFGDVWLVEFSGADRTDLTGGHLQIELAWTEVA